MLLSGIWRRAMRLRGKLQIEGGPEDGRELSLGRLPLTIGRGDETDLMIIDRWVSRRHCEIFERDGMLAVRDLGSRHGTQVNGEAITETALNPGDRLCLGLTTLIAHYEPRNS